MTTAAVKYDPKALAVGQAVLRENGRGGCHPVRLPRPRRLPRGLRHRPAAHTSLWQDSDVREKARIGWGVAESFYGICIPVDVVGFTPGEFHHLRYSINSVAAIAAGGRLYYERPARRECLFQRRR